jgi:MFS family permease
VNDATADPLVTPTFPLVTVTALMYSVSIGVLIPTLPRYVEDVLHGGGVAVGLAVGAFSFSAAIVRPPIGRFGDRRGRRILVIGGAIVAAVSIAAYTFAGALWQLVLLRLVTGVGEAALFVGAATAIQDMAPASRRGEAASYFSVAVYGGLAIGPALGEIVRKAWGWDAAWLVAGAASLVAAVLGWWTPDHAGEVEPDPAEPVPDGPVVAASGMRGWLHPAALLPGSVLLLAQIGYAGFSVFVPLYVDDLGLDGAKTVFAIYAVMVLMVRVFGARLPDRLGPVKAGTAALIMHGLGLAVMAAWQSAAGLYVGTVLFAVGISLLFPALMTVVIDNAPARERSAAVGTFSVFFDLSQGIGALILGGVVAVSTEPAAFAVSALLAGAALAVLRTRVRVRVTIPST